MAESSSLVGKLEREIEIKASAEKFHEMFAGKVHLLSNVLPSKITSCVLQEGEWGQLGSVLLWNFVYDGIENFKKEMIEAVDMEKNLITFRVLEGDLMNEYKSFTVTIEVTPKAGEPGSVAHWLIEYEKLNSEMSNPQTLLEYIVESSKEIDEHLMSKE